MRSIADIKKEITTPFMANAVVQEKYGFTEKATFDTKFSKVASESMVCKLVSSPV